MAELNPGEQVVASVQDAQIVKTPSDGIRYRVAGLWVKSADAYFAYVLTLIAGAMTANGKQIGKPIADTDVDQEEAAS